MVPRAAHGVQGGCTRPRGSSIDPGDPGGPSATTQIPQVGVAATGEGRVTDNFWTQTRPGPLRTRSDPGGVYVCMCVCGEGGGGH